MNILIVEDDIGLAELIKDIVEECGFKTASVQTAGEALKKLKEDTEVPPLYQLNLRSNCRYRCFLMKSGLIWPGFLVKTAEIPSPRA